MLSGLFIKIIHFFFFHFTSSPLVYLMFTPINT